MNSFSQNTLLKKLELISESISNRILQLKGYVICNNGNQESLEIIIFRGISSSTTHPTNFEVENSILPFNAKIIEGNLLTAPITPGKENVLLGPLTPEEFTKLKNWLIE